MIIIHGMNNASARPRLLQVSLARALSIMPVVVVTGARQAGKTTLVRELSPDPGRLYLTLDDLDVLDQAERAAGDLVTRSNRMTIDEVQRAPQLLHSVKRAVDARRTRGRFILTGSANLLLMRRVAESLAGRATYLTLWPLTRREQLGMGSAGIWSDLLGRKPEEWLDIVEAQQVRRENWRESVLRGGYPTPAIELDTPEARSTWFTGYTRTYLERDLQEISSVAGLLDLRRLMRAACLRVGQLINQTELARDVALPQPTVHRHLNLLETSYQLVRLPAYAVNRTKRLIKTPKLYWADTGLACHLAGLTEPTGAYLENMVLADLLAWRDAQSGTADIFYWRTATGEEVDLVIEIRDRLLPIEIKAAGRPATSDIGALHAFRSEYGRRCPAALLLHTGDRTEWLAPGILAAPWWRVI
jgi:predicted AAA+ superfamily ATPase